MLNQDIVREATRLTRTGQLMEATELLQRMLRGDSTPDATPDRSAQTRPARLAPPTIEGEATRVGEREREPAPAGFKHARATQAKPARAKPAHAAAARKWSLRQEDFGELPGFGLRNPLQRTPAMADIAPKGTRYIEGSFSDAAGRRAYKLFVPGHAQGRQLPLIVMLHGCTQSPDDFAAGTRMNFAAEQQNCFVVYPEQPNAANQSKCWNWFRTGDQQRDSGEPALIAGITRQVMRDHAIDPNRVYIAGLSAGGAAAAIMAATYPDLYAAVGIHSGLPHGAARDLPSAMMAMRQGGAAGSLASGGSAIPVIVFHGDRDQTVHPANGDRIVAHTSDPARETSVVRGRVPDGHAYTRKTLTDAQGQATAEHWSIHGAGHAWSGGSPAGSYTDPKGPDASKERLRVFLAHSRAG